MPGDLYIDPIRPVPRAVITHGHADHARPGHGKVLATPETLAIMEARYGPKGGAKDSAQTLSYGTALTIDDLSLGFAPAGHVLGSAQAVLTAHGQTAVVSGDYKRRSDPTCVGFEPVPCDVFITEATFALPVFRHPPADQEIAKLLRSVALYPDRCHLVGAYSLGKAQRVLALLRAAGWDRPIYLHGAHMALCALYESLGVALGPVKPIAGMDKRALQTALPGEIILAPPSALNDRWAAKLPDPVTVMASGWMRVRARARQRGAELPLIISDHADWDELTDTLRELRPTEVWVTHGREDALVHQAGLDGIAAKSLSLIGYDDEGEDGP